MSVSSYNNVVINLDHLRHNYLNLSKLVGEAVRILPMIKSAAYGHGLVRCASALAEAGADCFGVAEADEGVALRQAGIAGEIIVFLGTNHYDALVNYQLSPVVFARQEIEEISACALHRRARIGVHLKIDVGMGRLGVMPEQVSYLMRLIETAAGVYLAGILGHFSMADQIDSVDVNKAQLERFAQIGQDLAVFEQENKADICLRHIANSAALICHSDARLAMVRPGISLYGCYPAEDEEFKGSVELKPVMSFRSQIVQIKEVPAGYGISYGHLFVTERPSRLAILPVGYADGYLRCLTGKAQVLICGQRAPVCGRICMNASVVDITDIEGGVVGDEVVLMGAQHHGDNAGMISAEEIAAWMDTINYEVLCLFGNSNNRLYIGAEDDS